MIGNRIDLYCARFLIFHICTLHGFGHMPYVNDVFINNLKKEVPIDIHMLFNLSKTINMELTFDDAFMTVP